MDRAINNKIECFTINCREIPETIFVETRFLTLAAAKQKKYEKLYYLINKNGSMEISSSEDQFMALMNFKNMLKPANVNAGLQQAAPIMPQLPVVQLPHTPAIAPLTNLTSVRPVSITKISNGLMKNNEIRTTACLPRTTVIPNNVQMPVVNVTTNSAQTNVPFGRSLKDNMQQTELSAFNMKSVAIQCRLEEENSDIEYMDDTVEETPENTVDIGNVKEIFLKFAQENSAQYKDFKECLICGEICKSNKYFFSHMAIHQGPKVLCSKCGFCFHKDLLPKHNCKKTKLLNSIYLQCPHYRCRVKAISRLELYDHINEHNNFRPYKCTACRKAFFTRQEFLRHILIRAKCFTKAKLKRYYNYDLENQRDRLCRVRVFTLHTFRKRTILVTVFLSRRAPKKGVCKICMKSVFNSRVYKSHHVKCVAKFRKRLIRKKYNARNA